MPQYSSKYSALQALARYFTGSLSIRPSEGASMSPAEDHLLGALSALVDEREAAAEAGYGQKFDPALEKAYRHMKSIAKCLGYWPLSKEIRAGYKLRPRLGFGVGTLMDTSKDPKWMKKVLGRERRWKIITGPPPERK